MSEIINSITKLIGVNNNGDIFTDLVDEKTSFSWKIIEAVRLVRMVDESAADLSINDCCEQIITVFRKFGHVDTFDQWAVAELRAIYRSLYLSFRLEHAIEKDIVNIHLKKLRAWCVKYSNFIARKCSDEPEQIDLLANSEYAYELQERILHLNFSQGNEPILDIGCGQRAILVNHLAQQGLRVFGFDRLVADGAHTKKSDWLEFEYGSQRWNCIISHLGFASHFRHHYFRKDGDYLNYGKSFAHILASLKLGGTFHYLPDLPFLEEYLNPLVFQINKYKVEGFDFSAVVIKKNMS